jgi:hypothetical protein
MPRSGLLAEQSVLTPQRAEADKRTCSRDPRSRSPIAVLDLTTEHIERADLSGKCVRFCPPAWTMCGLSVRLDDTLHAWRLTSRTLFGTGSSSI